MWSDLRVFPTDTNIDHTHFQCCTLCMLLCTCMVIQLVSTLNKLIDHKIQPISGLHLAFRKEVQVPKLLGRLNCLQKLKIMRS